VIGYIEPLGEEALESGQTFEFVNQVVGTNIPPEYIPSCEKGARDAMEKGPLTGHPAQVRLEPASSADLASGRTL
jgi:elongation factor G